LERYARGRTVSQALALRARIVLATAAGKAQCEVTQQLKITDDTARKWVRRFAGMGVAGLSDLPKPNVHRKLSDEHVEQVIRSTLESKPKGSTHCEWSSASPLRCTNSSHRSESTHKLRTVQVLPRARLDPKHDALPTRHHRPGATTGQSARSAADRTATWLPRRCGHALSRGALRRTARCADASRRGARRYCPRARRRVPSRPCSRARWRLAARGVARPRLGRMPGIGIVCPSVRTGRSSQVSTEARAQI
jgi:hypothetical protein